MKKLLSDGRVRLILIVALFFACLEGGSRLYVRYLETSGAGSPVLRPDTERLWKPGSLMRACTVKAAKPPGVFRIAALGDSSTYGTGVDEGEAYPCLLGRSLEGKVPGRKVEVINAGVPGYSTHQGLQLLRTGLLPYAPDLVIVNFLNCDVFSEESSDRARPLDDGMVKQMKSLLYRSDFYLLLRMEMFGLRRKDAEKPARLITRVPIEEYRQNLRLMAQAARGAGARVVYVVPPLAWFAPPQESYRDEIRRAARDEGAPLVDLYSDWIRKSSPSLYEDPCHPSVEGHRDIARTLAAVIVKMRQPDGGGFFTSCPPLGGGEEMCSLPPLSRAVFSPHTVLECHRSVISKSLRRSGPLRDFLVGRAVTSAAVKDIVRFYRRTLNVPCRGYLKEGGATTLLLGDQGVSGFFEESRTTMNVDVVVKPGDTEIRFSVSAPPLKGLPAQ